MPYMEIRDLNRAILGNLLLETTSVDTNKMAAIKNSLASFQSNFFSLQLNFLK